MAKTLPQFILSIIPLALLLFFAPACFEGEMKPPPPQEPKPAPSFSLVDMDGKHATLEDFKGKPLIINFWATWCFPCKKEMPELEKVYRERKGEGLAMVLINAKEKKDVVKDFIDKNGYTFTVLLDESGDANNKFEVFGLPTTFFIDKEGIIRYTYMGEMTMGVMKMGLKLILPKTES